MSKGGGGGEGRERKMNERKGWRKEGRKAERGRKEVNPVRNKEAQATLSLLPQQ